MMKSIVSIILFSAFCSYGQYTFRVIDQETTDPVPAAKIAVFRAIDSVSFYITDFNGRAVLKQQAGLSYRITAIGYDTLSGTLGFDTTLTIELLSANTFDAVVVTAQYNASQASNAIQKIQVVTADQIQRSGSNNLADILNYQTGIRLSNDNILGASMSLGGISGQNVKILIDGVPVIGRLDGEIDLSQINLNNIERIEIVEGPLSVNYGTNALGGTINLITKKETKESINIEINPFYESVGNYNLAGSLGLNLAAHTFTVSGGRNYFDGWSYQDPFFQFPKSRPADKNRFKTWKPKEQWFGELRYSGVKNNWKWSPYLRYFDEVIINRGLPIKPYNESALDDYYNTRRLDFGLNLNKEFKKSKLSVIAAYNYYDRVKNTYSKDLTTLEQTRSMAEGSQDTSTFDLLNLRAVYANTFNQRLSVEVGLDLVQETAVGKRIIDHRQTQGDYAAFVSLEWNIWKTLKFKPGIRYAYNTVYPSPLVPSANLFWKIKNASFRLFAARGFRAPTLKELYFDFVDINHNITGNPDLKAENAMNYGLSVNWIKDLKRKRFIKTEGSFYYNDLENLITLGQLTGSEYTYVNIGNYKTLGTKIGFSYHNPRFDMTFSGSYIGRYNLLSEVETPEVKPFSFSPEISSNICGVLIPKKLKINIFYKFNGCLQNFSLNSKNQIVQNEQDHYQLLDASITGFFLDGDITLNVGAKNLLNVTTVNLSGNAGGVHSSNGTLNAGRGRSVFISLKYQLKYGFKKNQK